MTDDLTKEEFCKRFVARMVAEAERMFGRSTFGDGLSVETYARQVAPIYWERRDLRLDPPEECADADLRELGEYY